MTVMLETPMKFSHVKPGDTKFKSGGLRDFFSYRDLGIAEATAGKVIAQLVRAERAPEVGTGWHRHVLDFHIVVMLKGWARFMYEDKEHLVEAGDVVHQRPGIVHYLFDYSRIWNISKSRRRRISRRWRCRHQRLCRRRRRGNEAPGLGSLRSLD